MKELKIYKCAHCGNIIGMIEDKGVPVVCCGEKMARLIANTSDGAKEKHVPVATFHGNTLKVKVGEVPHPMIEEHHISWIAVVSGNTVMRTELSHTGEPFASFPVEEGPVDVYAYCNLHGLWKISV